MLKLDKEKIQEGIATIRKAANDEVIADIQSLAVALNREADNSLKDETIKVCQDFEKTYNNTFVPAITELVDQFGEFFDIAEEMEKVTAEGINTTDAAFNVDKIGSVSRPRL